MKANGLILVVVGFAALVCAGCYGSPGRPGPEVVRPSQIMDRKLLFANNCAGCHGPEGKGGAAIALNDPVYLAIADDTTIRRVAANGVPGTPMPAFAKSAGGLLTDQQIDAIVSGIRSWAKPDALQGATSPRICRADWRSTSGRRRVCNLLLGLSWSRWQGKQEGKFDCEWIVPCAGE